MFSVVSRIVCSKYKQMDFCGTSLLLPPGRTPILHPPDFCLCTDSKQLSEVESSAVKLLFIASQAWWQCWSISVPWSQISPSLFQFFFIFLYVSLFDLSDETHPLRCKQVHNIVIMICIYLYLSVEQTYVYITKYSILLSIIRSRK